MGWSEDSKGYRLFFPKINRVTVTKDVEFEGSWRTNMDDLIRSNNEKNKNDLSEYEVDVGDTSENEI